MKYAFGIDIGGTSVKCGLVSQDGKLLLSSSFSSVNLTEEEASEKISREVKSLFKESKLKKEDISGVGIGCPGSINSRMGSCDYSNNLKWKDYPICEEIEKRCQFKCKVTNDANAAVLCQYHFSKERKYENILFITLGTGVGSGLILNGKLYEGKDGKGAELGHSILKMNGRKCTCGQRGCLEAYASASALVRDTRKLMKEYPDSLLNQFEKCDGEGIFKAYALKDACATRAIERYVSYLGTGVLSFINIFRPDVIYIGGGLSKAKKLLLNPLSDFIKERHYGFGGGPKVEIRISDFTNDAGMFGAACLFM